MLVSFRAGSILCQRSVNLLISSFTITIKDHGCGVGSPHARSDTPPHGPVFEL
jgi:hypothetical protein